MRRESFDLGESGVKKSTDSQVFLVPTAMEESWPQEGQIVFLGWWCRKFARKPVWSAIPHQILPYHWDDRQKLRNDWRIIQALYESALPKLAQILNDAHRVNYSVRFWKILVGFWLLQFITITFDRAEVLRDAAEQFPAGKICVTASTGFPASINLYDFWSSSRLDNWNEHLFAMIARRMACFSFAEVGKSDQGPQSVSPPSPAHRSKKPISEMSKRFRGWLSFPGRVHFSADFIKPMEKLKLQLLLGQIPSVEKPRTPSPRVQPDVSQRQWKVEIDDVHHVSKLLSELIPLYLPASFLEGFEAKRLHAEREYKGLNPEVVVTGNSHFADDTWSFFAAHRVEAGAKLVILQHGGTYGAVAFSSTHNFEISLSDRFLSWGWGAPDMGKILQAPAPKLLGIRPVSPRRRKHLVHISLAFPENSGHISSTPVGSGVGSYYDDQLSFVRSLQSRVRKDLLIRPYPGNRDLGGVDWWKENEPEASIQPKTKFRDGFRTARLVVATYNATTFLETFRMSLPTVIFWDPAYNELSEEAKPYFLLLEEAKVFFTNPALCAAHVNDIWDDVESWWNSEEVMTAVAQFSDKFAYLGERPLRELRDALVKW